VKPPPFLHLPATFSPPFRHEFRRMNLKFGNFLILANHHLITGFGRHTQSVLSPFDKLELTPIADFQYPAILTNAKLSVNE
jgi:hypothetical protein